MPKNDINYNRLGMNLREKLHPLGTRVSEFRNMELASPLQNTVVTLPNKKIPRYYRRKDLIEVRRDRSG